MRSRLTRPARGALLLSAWALGALLLAPEARADDLYVSVERSGSAADRPRLDLRSSRAGPLEITLTRLVRPDLFARFAAEGLDLSRPQGLARALEVYELLLRSEPVPSAVPAPTLRRLRAPYPQAGQKRSLDVDPLAAGLHVVDVSQSGLQARALLLVSDLALVTKRDASLLLAWATDRSTGAPLAGVEVEAWAGGHAPLARGVTGSDGLVRLPGPLPERVRVVAARGADWALGSERWVPADVAARRVWLVTAQPAYRPGERVEVKGIVRVVESGVPALDPTAREARLTLVGPGERVLAEARASVDPGLGTFAAGFPLPADAPTGAGEVRAELDGRTHAAPLTIDAYRRPAFEVRVTAADPRVQAGGHTTFRVAARGYDGSLLAGRPVSWQLLHHRVERELFPEDELLRLFFGSEREAFAPVPLAQGQGTLDATSTLAVPAHLPATLAEGWVTLRATVTGPDGLAVAGSGGLGLVTSPVRVALTSDRHLYGPEDQAHVRIRVERADGLPAGGRRVALSLLPAEATDGSGAAATPSPAPPPALASVERVTDERGEAVADLTLPRSGAFVLLASVQPEAGEQAGPPATARRRVWAVGEHASLGYDGQRLEVVADRDAYAVGDEARLLVLSPLPGRPLLATLEGATLLDARVLVPDGRAALYTLRLLEAHVPNVWAAFACVDRGGLLGATRLLRLPPVTRLLTTTVAPDDAVVGPGAASGATLTVTDAAGRPVPGAEVALAVVDEALHALFPDPVAPLAAFFHPVRRNGVASGGPLHLRSVGHGRRALPPAKAAGGAACGAGGRACGAGGRDGGGPNAQPAPAPAAPAPAGPPAGDARPAEARLPERAAGEEAEASRADGDAPESKKSKDDGGPAPTAARADFRSSVFWAPALRTGPDGRVRVEGLRYADTLTRWRLTAHTVDAHGRVGSSTGSVEARKDLAVEVGLPRFLRVGDRADAPVLVTNLTAEPVTGGAYAGWSQAPGADEGGKAPQLPLPPRVAQESGRLELRPTAVGTLHVRARAEAGAARDALERAIPVLPRGFEAVLAAYGERAAADAEPLRLGIDLPRDLDRSTLRARLTLEPTALAAALEALPTLVEYPYGCTEQTLSRFEPLLIVAEALERLGVPRRGLLARTDQALRRGLERLYALQREDGGFGWWPGDAPHLEMTARAVRGLARAARRPEAAPLAAPLLGRAVQRLLALTAEPGADDRPSAALALLALAEAGALPAGALERGLDTLVAERAGPLASSLYLQATLAAGRRDLAAPLAARLAAQAQRVPGGVVFGPAGEGAAPPERWQDDPVETTALALHALLAAGAGADLVAPGVAWLLRQRVQGVAWRSTRDTAAVVALLSAEVARERAQGVRRAFRVSAGGRTLGTIEVDPADPAAPAALDVSALEGGAAPGDGRRLELAVEGPGAVAATLTVGGFVSGPAVGALEAGFRVERRWFRLEPVRGEGRVAHERVPVTETVPAGTLLECELTVTSDRARDFVQLTDPHAAGFEPERALGLDVRGRAPALEAEVQRYDDRTEFFVTRLAAGTHVLRHLVRATHAGAYAALPARARLMYFPSVQGSSRGEVLEITPAKGGAR